MYWITDQVLLFDWSTVQARRPYVLCAHHMNDAKKNAFSGTSYMLRV